MLRSEPGRFLAQVCVTAPVKCPASSAASGDATPSVTWSSGLITALFVALTASAATCTPLWIPSTKSFPPCTGSSRATPIRSIGTAASSDVRFSSWPVWMFSRVVPVTRWRPMSSTSWPLSAKLARRLPATRGRGAIAGAARVDLPAVQTHVVEDRGARFRALERLLALHGREPDLIARRRVEDGHRRLRAIQDAVRHGRVRAVVAQQAAIRAAQAAVRVGRYREPLAQVLLERHVSPHDRQCRVAARPHQEQLLAVELRAQPTAALLLDGPGVCIRAPG